MRTLVGAADPPPRRPVDGYTFTTGNATTASVADAVITMLGRLGHTVNPWQAVVIREAYAEREPYRTTAIVERRRAIERVERHASPGCACGVNAAGEAYVDPICG